MPFSEIFHNEEPVGTSFVEAHPLPLPTRVAFIGNYLPVTSASTRGMQSENKRMIEVGCESLKWLVAEQHRSDADIFVPIGSRECFVEGSAKARFDQQPVEACATISGCLLAYRLTSEQLWLEEAWCAFRWFLGENDLQIPLYDAATGGCRDGLHPDRVNENPGAESTLSFLMALLEMQSVEIATVEELNQEMSVTI
jgi:hypothetical protein